MVKETGRFMYELYLLYKFIAQSCRKIEIVRPERELDKNRVTIRIWKELQRERDTKKTHLNRYREGK